MDAVIIGGGASGVLAAINAKTEWNHVTIIERNSDLLKKLLMTGNGKCNYLNEDCGIGHYHSSHIEIAEQIISRLNVDACKRFFDSIGIVPKVKNGYYYPFSNQASTIKNALLKEVKDRGISILTDCLVEDIVKRKGKFLIKSNLEDMVCDYLVLAAGGSSYPKTGSDGSGYRLLEKLGHTIIKPLPALVQLKSNFRYRKEWAGIRSDVELSLFEDGRFAGKDSGEIQLTDYGISGICTFNLSHIATRGLDAGKKEIVKINFLPFIEGSVSSWMEEFAKKHPTKNISELLDGIFNYKLVNIFLKYHQIPKESYYRELGSQTKRNLCDSLKAFPIEITGTKGMDSAQVCNGGVELTEINPRTMESNLVKQLYITGELLDLNGNCGGYNLTECWISGMLAGKDIREKSRIRRRQQTK